MPDIRTQTQSSRLSLTGAAASAPLDLLRRGMPSQDSIRDDKTTFKPTPGGPTYRILKTTEVDAYESSAPAQAFRKALHGVKTPTVASLTAASKLPVSKRAPAKGRGKESPRQARAATILRAPRGKQPSSPSPARPRKTTTT